MGEPLVIIRVALFTPLRRLFDYLPASSALSSCASAELNSDSRKDSNANSSLNGSNCSNAPHSSDDLNTDLNTGFSNLQPGIRVKIPFGKSQRIGVVVEIAHHSEHDFSKLKRIEEILDEKPLFTDGHLKLFKWASQYYHCSLGEVLEAALPTWLRKGKVLPVLAERAHAQVQARAQVQVQVQVQEAAEQAQAEVQAQAGNNKETIHILNTGQQQAVTRIVNSLQNYAPFLLEGVTGSGKTEVYMQVIEKCLEKGLQTLVLVPEIGLTPQMLARFEKRFSVPIAVLHSSISEKKRATAWLMAKEGIAPIVIGTRSSAFTPLKSPGVFIIDEEHDASFKQQDGFRYSARDLMIMRAHLEKCPIVLGSATPSLESIQNTRTARYTHLHLPLRAGNATLPAIHILDVRHKKLDEGLSSQFIAAIKTHLEQKGQILIFLNRRGFAPALMCFDCGFVAQCKHCDAKLTLHFQSQKLRCHHCEFSCNIYERCPSCTQRNLQPLGVGTERVEVALKRHFPDKEILRIDRDSTSRKGKMEEALTRIHNQEAHILLGTQMLAKGHHFPNVTLVGILNIDQALFSNDFRSTERLGQLITQVAGRAGRSDRIGQVLLQTCHPEHPLLKTLIEKGYKHFAENLLLERRATELPPFSYQALIRSETQNNTEAFNFLKHLKIKAQKFISDNNLPLHILGPVNAPMEKKEGRYRFQLLFQAEKRSSLQNLMNDILQFVEVKPPPRSLRWSFDIDPIDMF